MNLFSDDVQLGKFGRLLSFFSLDESEDLFLLRDHWLVVRSNGKTAVTMRHEGQRERGVGPVAKGKVEFVQGGSGLGATEIGLNILW